MIRNLLFGGSKCRTIDKVDIFGDSSGVALYRLDGNANDESGNYHGTETGINTYGGGQYERGLICVGAQSTNYVTCIVPNIKTISCFVLFKELPTTSTFHAVYGQANNLLIVRYVSSGIYNISSYLNGNDGKYYTHTSGNVSLSLNTWVHFVQYIDSSNRLSLYINGTAIYNDITTTGTSATYDGTFILGQYAIGGSYTAYTLRGSIDQVRIFNRAITATEVATLYAECAPTSTVDNINPFEDGSLKALYQFNGNNTDKTGVYNTLFTGATTYTTGKFGQAGIIAGVASGTANIPFPASTGSCTMSWWGNNTGTRGGAFTFSQDASHYVGVYAEVANSIFYGGTATTTAGTIPYTATIRHYAMVFNAGKVKVYVDGAWTGVEVTMSAGFTTINTFTDGGSTASMFADQVRIFNKALTPMEVAALYNETTPMEEPMHSLVDPFKDGSGKALYRLEGNALDESGNYDGTATSVTYGAGRFGRAGVFNGSSSFIECPLLRLLGYTNGYSVSCWVKTNIVDAASNDVVISQVNDGNYTAGYAIFNYNGNLGVTVYQKNTAAQYINGLANNQWRHVVLAISADGFKAYLDGTMGVDISSTASVSIGTNNVFIGKVYTTSPQQFFNGSIDQVRIFNRALTQTEVTALYTEI